MRSVARRSLRSIVAAGAAVAVTCAAGAGAAAGASKPPCTAKPVTIGGEAGLQLCGPATASVRVGGRTYTFRGGFCAQDLKNSLTLQLSLGTSVPSFGGGKLNAGKPYLVIDIGRNHSIASVMADVGGRAVVPHVAITVGGAVPAKGTFASSHGSPRFTGTWSCNGPIYQLNQ